MCLGESTTQRQYPIYLKDILNRRNIGIEFSVIDKGRAGTNTSTILSQVIAYLDEYHPDMVITMMGINDRGGRIPYEATATSNTLLLFRSLRTYKLTRLLWLHIVTKAKEIGIYKPKKYKTNNSLGFDSSINGIKSNYNEQTNSSQVNKSLDMTKDISLQSKWTFDALKRLYMDAANYSQAKESFEKALELNPKDDDAYIGLGVIYLAQKDYLKTEESFKTALAINPLNRWIYIGLGESYKRQGKYAQAEQSFIKAIELNPRNDEAYSSLGEFYYKQGKYAQAEELFKKAIELNPRNDEAYSSLGEFYCDQGENTQAEELFKKAIELNPRNDEAYSSLGELYCDQGENTQAEELFKKAIELNPRNDEAYSSLGKLYCGQGKNTQAVGLFKKAIELNPKNERAYGRLATIYSQLSNRRFYENYQSRADQIQEGFYNYVTVNNYRMLKQILDSRKIRLVCVQYPLCSVAALKKIFEGQEGVIFVDNEEIFKNAIFREGYREYFVDMFGGNFGHCTKEGNRLLAKNIADAILKVVFKK